jgi:hypothetical protein
MRSIELIQASSLYIIFQDVQMLYTVRASPSQFWFWCCFWFWFQLQSYYTT